MKIIQKYVFFLMGLIILGMGTALIMVAYLGSDGYNIFCQSIAFKIGVMPGTVGVGLSLLYLSYIFIFVPSYRTVGTVISTFAIGTIHNIFLILLGNVNIEEWNFFLRCIVVLLGLRNMKL